MQQTDKYKFNLIETSDPLSPAPLNENVDKLDGVLSGLNHRVVTLENCRIVVGRYMGTGENAQQIINLGERPVAVVACYCGVGFMGLAVGDLTFSSNDGGALKLLDNGFWVHKKLNMALTEGYSYIAFLGGWEKNDPVSKQP